MADEARAAVADLCGTRAWAVEEKPGAWRLRERPGPAGSRSLPLVSFLAGAEDRYLEYTRAVAEAVFAKAEKEGRLLGHPGVWATEKPKLLRIVENYLALDIEHAGGESRYPALLEQTFGGRGEPELRLGGEADGIRLHGRVDRVDLIFDEAGRLSRLLVVDYKGIGRGGLSPEKYTEEMAQNLDCQLPVYAFAAQQVLFGRYNEPDLNAMTDAVYHIQDRKLKNMLDQFKDKRVRLAGDESGSTTQRFSETLAAHLARLRAADFSVDPLDCEYCEFGRVCRVDVNALESAAGNTE